MSVDYRAYSGIGYEVVESDDLEDSEELEDGLHEYIYMECDPEFMSFEIGSAYSGEITGTYLCIKDPFKSGLDLSWVKEKLDSEVERLSLEAVGDLGVVGGLYIY